MMKERKNRPRHTLNDEQVEVLKTEIASLGIAELLDKRRPARALTPQLHLALHDVSQTQEAINESQDNGIKAQQGSSRRKMIFVSETP